MSYNFSDELPIYFQITEHIKLEIIGKKYLPKQKLPSVRDLSIEFEVNPNTVQKALFELESTGLIYTERTNGKYVTDNVALIEKIKKQAIQKKIDDFYSSMAKIGIDKERVFEILNEERSKK